MSGCENRAVVRIIGSVKQNQTTRFGGLAALRSRDIQTVYIETGIERAPLLGSPIPMPTVYPTVLVLSFWTWAILLHALASLGVPNPYFRPILRPDGGGEYDLFEIIVSLPAT